MKSNCKKKCQKSEIARKDRQPDQTDQTPVDQQQQQNTKRFDQDY